MSAAPTVAQQSPPGAAAARARRRGAPRRDTLAREITVVLCIKLTAIVLLWFAFFRPAAAPPAMPAAQSVGQHIAAPATPSEVPVVAH